MGRRPPPRAGPSAPREPPRSGKPFPLAGAKIAGKPPSAGFPRNAPFPGSLTGALSRPLAAFDPGSTLMIAARHGEALTLGSLIKNK